MKINPKIFEINPKIFYITGKYIFFIIAVIGGIRILDLWEQLKAYDVFSMTANSIFYFILAGFFAYLQGKEQQTETSDKDILLMEDALNKLNMGVKDAKIQKRRG